MGYTRRATALAVLALASGMSMTTARAASQASASVTFSYTLIDLTPEDGVTPFFKITPAAAGSSLEYTAVAAAAGGTPIDQSGGPSTTLDSGFLPVSIAAGSAGNQASATATPTSWMANGQFTEAGQGYSAAANTSVSSSYSVSPEGDLLNSGFELSPNSVLLIRANVDMHAAVSPSVACGALPCADGYVDDANVYVSVSFNADSSFYDGVISNSGYTNQDFTTSARVSNLGTFEEVLNPSTGEYETTWQPASTTDLAFDGSRLLNFVLTNNSPVSLFATAAVLTQVDGSSYANNPPDLPVDHGVPAVPEPATWATMALGLVGMATVMRRRQRQA